MSRNGKPKLRFAALRRVSTERQEKTGESLRTQTAEIGETVRELGGSIVEWYGGQEHATPGHEKKEVDRLVRDAGRKRFDAVIVSHPDRWSRDNSKSREGLEVFREHGIRFYAGSTEFDLFNPDHELFLGISSVVGQFFARNQTKKSLLNRIARAKRGIPTAGKLPFGRTFIRSSDGQTGHWEIDKEKQALIRDCAKRYLDGESLEALAGEYGVNHPNLHKVLTKVSGPKWEMTFSSKPLNVHEVVTLDIPPLLPEDVIKAIRARLDSNRTFTRGHIKNRYLFSRTIFCAHCGYAMFGQTNHQKFRYYRHAHSRRDRECPGPDVKAWIPADDVEDVVMRRLFETFGNPAAVRKAIEAATPNTEKVKEAIAKRERTGTELKKAQDGLQRILDLVVKGTITDADADVKLTAQKERIQTLEAEAGRLDEELANVPGQEEIRAASRKIAGRFLADSGKARRIDRANRDFGNMTWEEKRELLQMIFSGRTADGGKMGVKITWKGPKKWRYRIEGRFIDAEGGPIPASRRDDSFVFGAAPGQKKMVTKNAWSSRGRGPR